jgi:hypothetical protein
MGAHISEFPVGSYKKSHRHGPGAHLIILNGKGYTLLWEPGKDEAMKVDWKPGTIVVPPDQWFHQHFNSGAEPARYLALRWNSCRFKSVMKSSGEKGSYTSIKLGGNQIEFEDENPAQHREFVAEVERSGAKCQMCDYYPLCPKKGAEHGADAQCAVLAPQERERPSDDADPVERTEVRRDPDDRVPLRRPQSGDELPGRSIDLRSTATAHHQGGARDHRSGSERSHRISPCAQTSRASVGRPVGPSLGSMPAPSGCELAGCDAASGRSPDESAGCTAEATIRVRARFSTVSILPR